MNSIQALQKICATALKVGPISICLFLLLVIEEMRFDIEDMLLWMIFGSIVCCIIAFLASAVLFLPLTYYAEKHALTQSAYEMFQKLLPIIILIFSPLTLVPFLGNGEFDKILFALCYSTFFSAIIGWMIFTKSYCKSANNQF